MRISILDGSPDGGNGFDERLAAVVAELESRHELEWVKLREARVKGCRGCFGCWVRRPGWCVLPDETERVRQAYIGSDLVIFASPLLAGFPSALLKSVQDQLIPLLHPHFERVHGETHHRARYKTYPRIALLFAPETMTDDEDIDIVTRSYERMAVNFKTRLAFVCPLTTPVEELAHVLDAH